MNQNFEEVLKHLKQEVGRLQNRVDSISTVKGSNSKEFDALCYEMCAVETRRDGLLAEAKRELGVCQDKLQQVDKARQLLDRMVDNLRKVRVANV